MSDENVRLSISLRLAVDFLIVMYIKDKQMPVFNIILYLPWTDRGFPNRRLRELKYIDKRGLTEQ